MQDTGVFEAEAVSVSAQMWNPNLFSFPKLGK